MPNHGGFWCCRALVELVGCLADSASHVARLAGNAVVTYADWGWPSGSHRGREAGSHIQSHQPGRRVSASGMTGTSLSGDIWQRGLHVIPEQGGSR